MAVAYIEYGVSPGATSLNCVVTKPTNLAVGDFMLAHIGFQSATDTTAPAGWTQITVGGVQLHTSGTGTSSIWWKFATATDVSAANFTFSNATSSLNKGAISTYSGVDTGTPIGASNGQYNSSVTCTAPTITPPVANCMIVLTAFARAGGETFSAWAIATSDPGMSEKYDVSQTVSIGMSCAVRPQTTATGNGTSTISGNRQNIGFLIALQPRGTTASSSSSSSSTWIKSSSSSSSSSSTSSSTSSSSSSSSNLGAIAIWRADTLTGVDASTVTNWLTIDGNRPATTGTNAPPSL